MDRKIAIKIDRSWHRKRKSHRNTRMNTIIYKSRVYLKTNNTYRICSPYVNDHTKIWMQHLVCGHYFKMQPNNFLYGQRCPHCHEHVNVISTSGYNKKVMKHTRGRVSVVGEANRHTKRNKHNRRYLILKCNNCGYKWSVRSDEALSRKDYCRKCSLGKAIYKHHHDMNTKILKERVRQAKNGDQYRVLGKYIDIATPIKWLHIPCGTVFSMSPDDFLSHGHRCPHCNGGHKESNAHYLERFNKIHKGYYRVVSSDISQWKPVKVKCMSCGRMYTVKNSNYAMYDKHFCRKCYFKHRMDNYKKELRKLPGTNHFRILSTQLKNYKTRILIEHITKDPHFFFIRPQYFLENHNCPICHVSNGEYHTNLYLKLHHFIPMFENIRSYDYIYGYAINAPHEKANDLHFDFYFPKWKVAIEVDGAQHFIPVKPWGGKQGLKYRKQNDHTKDLFCKKHHIKLIRIPLTPKCNSIKKIKRTIKNVMDYQFMPMFKNKVVNMSLF